MKYSIQDIANLLQNNPDIDASDVYLEACLAPAHVQLEQRESERDIQARIFAECGRRSITDDRWRMIFAIPNGQYRRGQMMEPGMVSGIPDIFCAVMAHGYGGLFIELKTDKGRVRKEQNEWINRLNEAGYRAVICRGYEAAIAELEWYLND